MPDNDLPDQALLKGPGSERPLTFVLIGCGGTGCNLLAEKAVSSVDHAVALSSEPGVLRSLDAAEKLRVEVGKVEQDARALIKGSGLHGTEIDKKLGGMVKGADVAFIIAGLGGYTGGWSAVVASRAAGRSGCLTICIASEPFTVEGRGKRAGEQLRLLLEHADAVLVLPNDMILAEAPNLPISKAFMTMNKVLASPVELLVKCTGKGDLKVLGNVMGKGMLYTMDVAQWDGTDAVFSISEQLGQSKWLGLSERDATSLLLFVEGNILHDDLAELRKLMGRKVGPEAGILMADAGPSEVLRVTAMAGFRI